MNDVVPPPRSGSLPCPRLDLSLTTTTRPPPSFPFRAASLNNGKPQPSPPSSPIKASSSLHHQQQQSASHFSPSHYHRNMAAPAPSSQNPTSSSSASSSPLPSVHKTTASGHNLLVRIPDGPSGALTARQAEPEHPMLWGMQLRYVSCVSPPSLPPAPSPASGLASPARPCRD